VARKENEMKKIGDLKYEAVIHNDLQLGGMRSCLEFLGIDMSLPWLAGATGHAFTLAADEVMCPSCPSCIWGGRPDALLELARNVGMGLEYVFGPGELEDRKEAWDFVRNAIDNGRPCYGPCAVCWGYDDIGYYLNDAKEPKPWEKGIVGWTEVYSVQRVEPADDTTTVKDALAFAIGDCQLGNYDNWIEAIAGQRINCGDGGQCDAGTWFELRRLGVQFLDEARARIGGDSGPLFEEAKAHYQEVCTHLEKVAHTFRPETMSTHAGSLEDEAVRKETVEQLEAAKAAEAEALGALERIVALL